MLNNPNIRWGLVLGFAIGGFFDGILLHQILQWHHLLSLVPSVDTIRLQVLWDGYFHALMYVIAAIGLWGLWRNRDALEQTSGRGLGGAILVGFGVWHVVDSVVSHWAVGIHRIKLDSANPLLWDLFWFVAFGVVPLLIGWLMLSKARTPETPTRSTLSIMALGVLTTGTALWSSQPPIGQRFTTVVFSPAVSPAKAVNAVVAEGGTIVWSDPTMSVLVIVVPQGGFNFYRRGALLVSGSAMPEGCLGWSTI